VIRAARGSDAPAITDIWNHYIRHTTITFLPDEKSHKEVADLIASQPVLVWDAGDGVRAFARYFPFRSGRGYAQTVEHTVLLAPDIVGKGIGRKLMSTLCDHAGRAGHHSMWAGVSGENPQGVAFHLACGFSQIARLPEVGRKFDRWIDLVLMQKRL
jgi:phosphinothricin acetyltransferase